MALFSETDIKPHERFSVPSYYLYCMDYFPGDKRRAIISVKNLTCIAL